MKLTDTQKLLLINDIVNGYHPDDDPYDKVTQIQDILKNE